ncbi:hypothetical protein EJB05_29262, partial [Eragrostis curvula]
MAAVASEKMHEPAGVGEAVAFSASSSPPAAAIRIVDTFRVHPSPPTPEETSLPLTFLDVFWVPKPPLQLILFYRLVPGVDWDTVVAKLRDSLSHAVRAFFPLAGRLRLTPGSTADRYELYYRSGDAVAFTVAGCEDDFDSLAAYEPREVTKIAPLAPPLPDGGAVLALQATLLPARGGLGLALGFTVHHAACDGAAATHFLHTWAAAACSAAARSPPVIDRTLISVPRGLYNVLSAAAEGKVLVKMPDDQLLATFTLSRANLQRVKDVVAASTRCTSLVAALGFVWSCYQRAKQGDGGRSSFLALPVDHRSRMRPPLPAEYFGNCVGFALAIASIRDLAEASVSGRLLAACTAIAAGIEEAVSGVDTETAMEPSKDDQADAMRGLLTVAESPRFRMYDLDMGFGRPVKVDIVSAAKTGVFALAESRAGDGGIEVGVSLPPEGMDAFRNCFADAVARL